MKEAKYIGVSDECKIDTAPSTFCKTLSKNQLDHAYNTNRI